MRYTDILLEYNRDQTVKNYGEKILAVAIKDRTVPWLVIFQDQPERNENPVDLGQHT